MRTHQEYRRCEKTKRHDAVVVSYTARAHARLQESNALAVAKLDILQNAAAKVHSHLTADSSAKEKEEENTTTKSAKLSARTLTKAMKTICSVT